MFEFQLCERGVWGKFPEGRLYERKLDGTRALAIKLEDKVKLINRRGFEYTDQFPEIVADLLAYPHHALMLDGEICDRDFSTLAGRTHLQDRFKIEMRAKLHPCTFWVFDVPESLGCPLTLPEDFFCTNHPPSLDKLERQSQNAQYLRKHPAAYAHQMPSACELYA